MKQLINHVVFVLDESGSMQSLTSDVIAVFDNQVKFLAKRSTEVDQETRVSVYAFSNSTRCLFYDKDVLRLPSLASMYRPGGGTALIDASLEAIKDLKMTPEIHADHAFLVYAITDGYENQSRNTATALSKVIGDLAENWTLGIFVPDQAGEQSAATFGFPAGNITQWDISAKGMKEAETKMQTTTNTFFAGRAAGVRGTKSLFKKIDVNVSTTQIKKKLTELPKKNYKILQPNKDRVISEYVTQEVGSFQKGNSFYQLIKTEEIQPYKQVAIQDRATGKVYVGDEARNLLQLPTVKFNAKPGDFKNWDLFIQSTSLNRKVTAGSKLLVLV